MALLDYVFLRLQNRICVQRIEAENGTLLLFALTIDLLYENVMLG